MNLFKRFQAVLLAGAFGVLTAQPLFAQERAAVRDMSVDNMLIKDAGWTGALPPTAGEGAALQTSGPANFVNPAFPQRRLLPEVSTRDRSDKKARVYEVKGPVKMAEKAGADWKSVKKGMTVKEGAVILTQKAGSVSITFDANYANVVYIPENTRAVFRQIEPTNIFLEDGTIYNFFDAVPRDGSWKVSSPTAVAGVRGTHFLVNFTAADGSLITATFNVPDDGKDSAIHLLDILQDGKEGSSVDIPEGQQLDLKSGQEPDASLLAKIDSFWLTQIQEFLEHLTDLRLGGGAQLPPTGGEFFEPGLMDTGGPDAIGGGPDNNFDPFLTNASRPDDPPAAPEQSEEFSEGGGEEYPPYGGEGEGCGPYCE